MSTSSDSGHYAYGGILGTNGQFAININSGNRTSAMTFEVTISGNSIFWYTTYSYPDQYWQFNENGRMYTYTVLLQND